jgi:diguanylate cyclase (GGDEF)-like protein
MRQSGQGISVKNANYVMTAITLVISVLLILTTYQANTGYSETRAVTDAYIELQKDASALQAGSDYLTEQVRCFAETGERVYLDNYFEEVNVTRQRDNAVRSIHEIMGDTPAYQSLVSAMGESVDLMDREYYSMRLKIEACGYDLSEFPDVIRAVELSAEDAARSAGEKDALARSMVFDREYHSQKTAISGNVQECLASLAEAFEGRRTATEEQLRRIMARQRAMIILTVVATVVMLLLAMLLIVRPLVRAADDIRKDAALPVTGAREFRFLAKTYNLMSEANRTQRQSITALLDNMPAMSFTKDVETGAYLACNQAFAAYAHKQGPEDVVGLTDAQLFDPVTAQHFVEDDRMALSMDEPYIFFEDVVDAEGNSRQLQMTKLKFIDPAGRACLLGMCADVTDMVRIQRETATTREAYERARSTGIIYSHIAQTLARSYIDLFYVNLETEEFIEYHTDSENGTLVEARRGGDFFAQCKIDAETYLYPDDVEAFVKAIDRETLLEALNRDGTFLLTYRQIAYYSKADNGPTYVTMKVSRMADDENYLIFAVTDVDEQMKQRREAERMEEQRLAYSRINALTGDFLCVYVVIPETGYYREYSATNGYETFALPKEGEDFFGTSHEMGRKVVCPEDVDRYLSLFTREGVLAEIERSGIFAMSYRLLIDGRPRYVRLKAAMVEEQEGLRLIVGINDIDAQVRQDQEYERRLARAQSEASIDALTGIKNKHAYMEAETRLDRQIGEHRQPAFALVIMDVNDLKKVNDTEGHQAGDQYLRDACSVICNIFKHSPVFRIGGDEFAVIAQDTDYANLEALLERLDDHNAEAARSGGVVIARGVARYENDTCVATVFERADESMYVNKSFLKSADPD